jgi:hypothetical protein
MRISLVEDDIFPSNSLWLIALDLKNKINHARNCFIAFFTPKSRARIEEEAFKGREGDKILKRALLAENHAEKVRAQFYFYFILFLFFIYLFIYFFLKKTSFLLHFFFSIPGHWRRQ